MRTFILITAMVLASATAHASDPRSLTMGSGEAPAKSTEGKSADATAAETPKYVERPSVVDTHAPPAAAQPPAQCQPAATTAETPKEAFKTTPRYFAATERLKRRRQSPESRIVSELHRHGIYW